MARSNPEIARRYQDLESIYRHSRNSGNYDKAKAALAEMQRVIQAHPDAFDEPEDSVRILAARSAMTEYRQAGAVAGRLVLEYLEEAAAWSVPSACLGTACDTLDPERCLARSSTLSRRQARMCVERISAVCIALKIEGALHARGFQFEEALQKRRAAVALHKALLVLDNPKRRIANQLYLEYWRQITEGYVALLGGDFGEANHWFREAVLTGRQLHQERCFPNYFRTVAELEAHPTYVKAIESVRAARFAQAHGRFLEWINIGPDRATPLRYQNARLLAMICDALAALEAKRLGEVDFPALERELERSYTARTTWALWTRLQWLRELAFRGRRVDTQSNSSDLAKEVAGIADDWRLFLCDAVLLGEDRMAGLRRAVTFPDFLDVSRYLDSSHPHWQPLLLQSVRNLLLLVADYERLRRVEPPPDETAGPPLPAGWEEWTEGSPLDQIIDAVSVYIRRRPESYRRNFEKSLGLLKSLRASVATNDFSRAMACWEDLLSAQRLWPHVILVEEQEGSPRPPLVDELEPAIPMFAFRARRMWNREPKVLMVETPQRLERGAYYYLRPRWNVREGEHYRLRHEIFRSAGIVRSMEAFYRGVTGRGDLAPERVCEWTVQFNESERFMASHLLSGLVVYDEERTRELWRQAFKKLPSEAKSDVAYVALGHGGKSGGLSRYSFRQGVSTLPEYSDVFRGKEKRIFRDLAEFEKEELRLVRPKTIVFLDDFVGTGGQAKDFLDWYYPRYEWLSEASVYLCVIVGFREALRSIHERLGGRVNAIAGQVLEEADRAFSPNNPIWRTVGECERVREWCFGLGRDLLSSCDVRDAEGNALYDPERDALGWYGCQALITFHHNVPSDTLPLFWARGPGRRKHWTPLVERHD